MRRYIWMLLLGALLVFNSCYDDNSTLATEASRVHAITVTGLKDTSAVAYTTILQLTPQVEGFSDDELSFAWYIYGGQYENQTEEGYRTVKIGEEKTLSWPVELKIGSYNVICEATHKSTGYFGLLDFRLNVTSAFSQGFYVLKETTEGNTELDFYNDRQKTMLNDILEKQHGAPMPGKPRNMNTVFRKAFIDPQTAKSVHATAMFVSSGENEFGLYSTEDLSKIFDRSTLLYAEMEADEVPYAMATAYCGNLYFSNKGVRQDDLGGGFGASEYATGQMAFPEGNGSSLFIQACDGEGMSYWNETAQRLMYVNNHWSAGFYVQEIPYKDGYDGVRVPWENSKAIASGWNHRAGQNTIWYLLEDAAGVRYLVFLERQTIREVRKLDASLHLSKSTIVVGNALTAAVIYSVENNSLYRYSLTEGMESSALSLAGLPQGTITYISDIFSSRTFDYIVIGVQNGEDYTAVMYKIAGGQPNGEPVHTLSGKGKLSKVCYAHLLNSDMPNYYAFTRYAELYGMGPDFPY